ncbi:hypothetical protein FOCC_FOCC016536 [Frankliniella occidentalis]|nr:hypothetical protein FOCC_FOCC016536 [Frankliniella occidentalis]
MTEKASPIMKTGVASRLSGMMTHQMGEIEKFEPYGPSSFSLWFKRFQIFCSANKIPPEPLDPEGNTLVDTNQRRDLFMLYIGTRAFDELASALLPDAIETIGIPRMVEVMKEMYEPTGMIQANRLVFHQRLQQPQESVFEYISALQTLAVACAWGNYYNQAMESQFIVGIRHQDTRSKIIDLGNPTWPEMKTLALKDDTKRTQMRSLAQAQNQIQQRVMAVSKSEEPKSVPPQQKFKPHTGGASGPPKGAAGPAKGASGPSKSTPPPQGSGTKFGPCHRCGRRHDVNTCPAINWTCKSCGKKGHVAHRCPTKPVPVKMVSVPPEDSKLGSRVWAWLKSRSRRLGKFFVRDRPSSESEVFTPGDNTEVNVFISSSSSAPLLVEISVNNKLITMEVDSGAVIYDTPLLGRPWLDALVPKWRDIMSPTTLISVISPTRVPSLEELKGLYPKIFDPNNDNPIVGFSAVLVLKDGATPIKHRAYKLAFGLTDSINSILDQMVQQGKAIHTRHAEWASPSFPVAKKDGSYRLVIDFKRSLNPQLRVDHYPIPSPEEIFSDLSKSALFVSLDLKDAYMQLPLSPESQELCTMATHRGFYKLLRLPFGIASAAAIFQSVMEEIVMNIPNVKRALVGGDFREQQTHHYGVIYDTPLLGRPWLDALVPKWRDIMSPTTLISVISPTRVPSLEELKGLYPKIFDPNNDNPIVGFSAVLVLKDGATPIKHRAYKLAFGLTDSINSILDQMVQQGKAIHTRHAEWASPSFPVAKKDGSYRLVIDFKRSLNPQLRVDHYPIPSPEEIFSDLSKSALFVSLDLKDAYMQLPLSPESQELCTMATHRGFYKLLRLPFGIASAAAIFQSVMEEIVMNIPNVKELLKSDKLLLHFNPNLPIVVYTDASPYGVGSALCHTVTLNNKPVDRPVMLVSSTLSPAQQNYAQIDREGLAVIYAISKFHRFLWGQQFTLVTDCQAISRIFNINSSLPVRTGHRLQHWASILQAYRYKLVHRKAANLVVADALSRLPAPITIEEVHVAAVNVKIATEVPLTSEKIASELHNDPVLEAVFRFVHLGWPPRDKFKNNPAILPYFRVRDCLTIVSKCLLFSSRVIIPSTIRGLVLKALHDGHPGIYRTKLLARMYVWWPSLGEDITQLVSHCSICALVNFKPDKVFVPWPAPATPFERVHIDFYERRSLSYFIVCDAYSKWLHVAHMQSTRAPFVIKELLAIFAIFGLPKFLVSDNGPPFDSNEYAEFCTQFNIKIMHSPPYCPQSNGQAEKSVDLAKKGMEKIILSENTPTTTTHKSPNELLFSFKPRTMLSQLLPEKNVPLRNFHFRAGEKVKFRLTKKSEIVEGVIVRAKGPDIYVIDIQGVIKDVHHNQLTRA